MFYGARRAQQLAMVNPQLAQHNSDNYVFYALEVALGQSVGLPYEQLLCDYSHSGLDCEAFCLPSPGFAGMHECDLFCPIGRRRLLGTGKE